MKLKTIYVCTACQAQDSRWAGQCMKCKAWNTMMEDVINVGKSDKKVSAAIPAKAAITVKDVKIKEKRLATEIGELDRVLGGGFMEDSLVLLVGDPGIGKSTLTIQMADQMAKKGRKVLYFSGEESTDQVAGRGSAIEA